jgi:phosphatidylglycerol---prolipoprotein diacylglyceryl transferase
MKPILMSLHLGGREIGLHTYGILIGCGCAAGIALAFREARRRGLDGSKILDLSFWMLVTGLVGSRLLYVALNAGAFARACAGADDDATPRSLARLIVDCTRPMQVWEGGLVFYGGFLAAGLFTVFFARRQRWSFWTLGDIFAPSLALGHAFGRLGCFSAGCCFGKACAAGARWCARFGVDSVAFEELRAVSAVPEGAVVTPPLFATQLYEAAGELGIFALLMLVRHWQRARPDGDGGGAAEPRPGTVLLLYAALYGLLRFVVEMYRGDFARRYLVELHTPRLAHWLGLPAGEAVLLSTGQAVSVAIVGCAVVLLLRRWRHEVSSEVSSTG